jgi:branched-subunit amino acid transport protein
MAVSGQRHTLAALCIVIIILSNEAVDIHILNNDLVTVLYVRLTAKLLVWTYSSKSSQSHSQS